MTDPFRSKKPVPPGFGSHNHKLPRYGEPDAGGIDKTPTHRGVQKGSRGQHSVDIVPIAGVVPESDMKSAISPTMKRDKRELPHSYDTPNESLAKVNENIVAGRRSEAPDIVAANYARRKQR